MVHARLKSWVHKLCEKYTFLDENAIIETIVVWKILIIAIIAAIVAYSISK